MRKYILILLLLLCTACGNNIQKNSFSSSSPSPEGKILYKIPVSPEDSAALPTSTPNSSENAEPSNASPASEKMTEALPGKNNKTNTESAGSSTIDPPKPASAETSRPAEKPNPATDSAPAPLPSGGMVWVSENGKKYHQNADCSNMKSPKQLTVSQAEAEGRTPCKKCY